MDPPPVEEPSSEEEWDSLDPGPPDALNMCCAHRHPVRTGAARPPDCLHVSNSWHRSYDPPYDDDDDDDDEYDP